MGVLGWSEHEALHSDMRSIVLAYEGWCDQRDGLARIIYRSAGAKIDDPPPRGSPVGGVKLAQKIRAFVSAHNATHRPRRSPIVKPSAADKIVPT